MDLAAIQNLTQDVINLSIKASRLILEHYHSDGVEVVSKADSSPLTKADKDSDALIRKVLSELTPSIPVLSEEVEFPPLDIRSSWPYFWLVDPLDGTKEFLEKTDEFTVNIALVENNKPVIGVIAVPVEQTVYVGDVHKGEAAKYNFSGDLITNLAAVPQLNKPVRIMVSRRHLNSSKVANFITSINEDAEMVSCGSSLKFCRLAENEGDIYPRFGQTGEWDTAAGHALLNSVGGEVYDASSGTDKLPLRYNRKDSVYNPEFVAYRFRDHMK